jgi:hypothetical protein
MKRKALTANEYHLCSKVEFDGSEVMEFNDSSVPLLYNLRISNDNTTISVRVYNEGIKDNIVSAKM